MAECGAGPPPGGHHDDDQGDDEDEDAAHRVKRCQEAEVAALPCIPERLDKAEAGLEAGLEAGAEAGAEAGLEAGPEAGTRAGLKAGLKLFPPPSALPDPGPKAAPAAPPPLPTPAPLRLAREAAAGPSRCRRPVDPCLVSAVPSRSARQGKAKDHVLEPNQELRQRLQLLQGKEHGVHLAALLGAAPALAPFAYLTGYDDHLPKAEALRELSVLRRPGFVRTAAARFDALVATADRLRTLLASPRQRQQQQQQQRQQTQQQLCAVQSESVIIPLHSPCSSSGGATTPGGKAVPTFAAHRFGEDSSTASSSTASSALLFNDDDVAALRHISCTLAADSAGSIPGASGQGASAAAAAAAVVGASERLPSVASCCCRICQNSGSSERLISPCNCKGSLAYVHLTCLERWLNQSGRTHCELCQYQFSAVQTRRYTRIESLRMWYSHPRNRRQAVADALIWAVLTLVTVALLAVTAVGMRYFVGEGAKLGVSAFTTEGTILFFLGLVAAGYLVTVFLLVRDQVMPWLRWWRATVDVRLTLDALARRGPRRPLHSV